MHDPGDEWFPEEIEETSEEEGKRVWREWFDEEDEEEYEDDDYD